MVGVGGVEVCRKRFVGNLENCIVFDKNFLSNTWKHLIGHNCAQWKTRGIYGYHLQLQLRDFKSHVGLFWMLDRLLTMCKIPFQKIGCSEMSNFDLLNKRRITVRFTI